MPVFELRVRLFFTSDECDVQPAMTICFPIENLAKTDWPRVLESLLKQAEAAVESAPLENLRQMTDDETAAYRASERGEE